MTSTRWKLRSPVLHVNELKKIQNKIQIHFSIDSVNKMNYFRRSLRITTEKHHIIDILELNSFIQLILNISLFDQYWKSVYISSSHIDESESTLSVIERQAKKNFFSSKNFHSCVLGDDSWCVCYQQKKLLSNVRFSLSCLLAMLSLQIYVFSQVSHQCTLIFWYMH